MMKDLDKLLDKICSAEYEYRSPSDGRTTTLRVCYCNSNERSAIAQAINEWAMGQQTDVEMEKYIGTLEAKIYAYEKIIANSNFGPMIQPIAVEMNKAEREEAADDSTEGSGIDNCN